MRSFFLASNERIWLRWVATNHRLASAEPVSRGDVASVPTLLQEFLDHAQGNPETDGRSSGRVPSSLALCSFIWGIAAPRWIERFFEKIIGKFILMLALISLLLLGVLIYVFSIGV